MTLHSNFNLEKPKHQESVFLRGPLSPAVTNLTGNSPSQVPKDLGLWPVWNGLVSPPDLDLHSEAESMNEAEVAMASPEALASWVPQNFPNLVGTAVSLGLRVTSSAGLRGNHSKRQILPPGILGSSKTPQ